MTKKLLILASILVGFVLLGLYIIPKVAAAATVSWDRPAVGRINPIFILDTVFGNIFTATSSTKASTFPYASTTALSSSNLSSGNCVQASTGGLLITTGNPCGSGSVTSIATTWPITGGTITTSGTLSFNGLSTSTAAVIGNIPYFSGVNTFANVATGTVSAGSSAITVTAGRSAVGGALAIDCATASGSQNGCLSSTDWTTFNNKDSFAWPFTSTTYNGILANATSTALWLKAITPFSLIASSTFATNASSTQLTNSGATWLTGLVGGAGEVGIDTNGKLYSGATTTAGTGLTYTTGSFNVNTSQSIATLSNLTTNGYVKTSGGVGTLSVQTVPIPIADGGTNNTTAYTAGSVIFSDGTKLTQDNSNLFWNDSTNRFGIGTLAPGAPITVNQNSLATPTTTPQGAFGHFIGADNTNSFFVIDDYGATDNHSDIVFRKAIGTAAAATGVITDSIIGQIQARGYDGTAFAATSRAGIRFSSAETWTTAAQGGYISFLTTVIGANTINTEKMRLSDAGKLGIGDASPASLLTVGASDAFQVDSTGRAFANVGSSGAGNLAYSFVGDTDTGLYESAANEISIQTAGADRITVVSGGNVGIGTTTPSRMLDVSTSLGYAGIFNGSAGTVNTGAIALGGTLGAGFIQSFTNDSLTTAANMVINFSGGNVGIGTSTPSRNLSVQGNSIVSGTGFFGGTLTATSTVFFKGLTTSIAQQTGIVCWASTGELINDSVACLASSKRYKERINSISDRSALDEILALNPISYFYTKEFNGSLQSNPNYNGEQVGFLAEDVVKIDPRLVVVDASGPTPDAPNSVRYQNLTAILAGAIKAQQAEIEKLKAAAVNLGRSAEENYQWGIILFLVLWVLRIQLQINRLKKLP